jgi:hypothetical protein
MILDTIFFAAKKAILKFKKALILVLIINISTR